MNKVKMILFNLIMVVALVLLSGGEVLAATADDRYGNSSETYDVKVIYDDADDDALRNKKIIGFMVHIDEDKYLNLYEGYNYVMEYVTASGHPVTLPFHVTTDDGATFYARPGSSRGIYDDERGYYYDDTVKYIEKIEKINTDSTYFMIYLKDTSDGIGYDQMDIRFSCLPSDEAYVSIDQISNIDLDEDTDFVTMDEWMRDNQPPEYDWDFDIQAIYNGNEVDAYSIEMKNLR